jgi:hypothetical protein
MRVDVLIVNNGTTRFDVFPKQFVLQVRTPNVKPLLHISPEEVDDSFESSTRWEAFFAGLAGSMAERSTPSMSSTNGSFSDHSMNGNSIRGSDYLSEVFLKANTLMPGQNVYGAVYFKRERKIESVLLQIPIAGNYFQFPFGPTKKQ